MGQQKQPHPSAFQLQWEHASPAFANQAEQLDTQQQVEQNWICAAPGTRSLAAPAASCVLPSKTAYFFYALDPIVRRFVTELAYLNPWWGLQTSKQERM